MVLLPFRVFPQRKLGIFLNRSFRRKRRKRTVFFTRNVLREREMFFCHARAKERRKGKERERRGQREEVSTEEEQEEEGRESARALKEKKNVPKNESQIVPKISPKHTSSDNTKTRARRRGKCHFPCPRRR